MSRASKMSHTGGKRTISHEVIEMAIDHTVEWEIPLPPESIQVGDCLETKYTITIGDMDRQLMDCPQCGQQVPAKSGRRRMEIAVHFAPCGLICSWRNYQTRMERLSLAGSWSTHAKYHCIRCCK